MIPYPIKAVFIPMEASDMDTKDKLKAYINETFMPAFHNGILGTKNAKIQPDQMPRLNKCRKFVLSTTGVTHFTVRRTSVLSHDWSLEVMTLA